jgi:predicted metal-binding membrane protein
MDMMSMMVSGEWSRSDWVAMCLMWVVMMIAMMLPSALPMILMFQVISTRRQPRVNPLLAVSMFTLGYILAWVLFSVLAAILQLWLDPQGSGITRNQNRMSENEKTSTATGHVSNLYRLTLNPL